MSFNEKRLSAVFFRHSPEQPVLGLLVHETVQHKAAGKQKTGGFLGRGERLGDEHLLEHLLLSGGQAGQQLPLTESDHLFPGKEAALVGILALHHLAEGVISPILVILGGILPLVPYQALVIVKGAADGVLTEDVGIPAVLKIPANNAPVIADVDVPVFAGLEIPTAVLLKAPLVFPPGKKPPGNAGPLVLVHHGNLIKGAALLNPLPERQPPGDLLAEKDALAAALPPGPDQGNHQLVAGVTYIEIHYSSSKSFTPGKWIRPQPADHSGMDRLPLVTSNRNSVTGLSRQTARTRSPSKMSR